METTDAALILQGVGEALLDKRLDEAEILLNAKYPFLSVPAHIRKNSEIEKTKIFLRDGFIDRYTGKKLVFIGMLRLITFRLPEAFPFHPHGKMDSCHIAYWELLPSLDHIMPIARGGLDQPENWITTSMLSNARKANWTLEELDWKLRPPGDLAEWDGLITGFMRLVEADSQLREQDFILRYYNIAKVALKTLNPEG